MEATVWIWTVSLRPLYYRSLLNSLLLLGDGGTCKRWGLASSLRSLVYALVEKSRNPTSSSLSFTRPHHEMKSLLFHTVSIMMWCSASPDAQSNRINWRWINWHLWNHELKRSFLLDKHIVLDCYSTGKLTTTIKVKAGLVKYSSGQWDDSVSKGKVLAAKSDNLSFVPRTHIT